jgi:hypothetical protein
MLPGKFNPFLWLMLFSLMAAAETEPNNTPSQANALDPAGTVNGILSGDDKEDWYVVQIPKGVTYTITITKSGAGNGTLYLLDGEMEGNPVLTSIGLNYGDSPGTGWTSGYALLAGKYYIRVIKYGAEVNYTISGSVRIPAFSEDREPNDTITSAIKLFPGEIFSGTLHYYDAGSGKDLRDWYSIKVDKSGILNLKIHKKGAGNTTFFFRDDNTTPGRPLVNQYLHYGDTPVEGLTISFPVLSGNFHILLFRMAMVHTFCQNYYQPERITSCCSTLQTGCNIRQK